MKANKTPEKIYLNWVNYPLEEMQVEYTRTDAFIKKACDWIKYNNENGGWLYDGWEEDFKKYMEK